MHRTVGIVGAGPAGIACAIQLKQSGVDFFLVNNGACGGQLNNAYCVENYPGIKPIAGYVLVRRFQSHLGRLGITIRRSHIDTIEYLKSEECFQLSSTGGRKVLCRFLVLATGTTPRRLLGCEVIGRTFYEARLLRKVKHKSIIVIGSGEAAIDGALSLAQRCKIILVRQEKAHTCVAQKLIAKVAADKNIKVVRGSVTNATLRGSMIEISLAGRVIRSDYLLVSVGRVPNIPVFGKGICKKRLFLCGAARTGRLGQAAMAVGDGISAAMEIARNTKVLWK